MNVIGLLNDLLRAARSDDEERFERARQAVEQRLTELRQGAQTLQAAREAKAIERTLKLFQTENGVDSGDTSAD